MKKISLKHIYIVSFIIAITLPLIGNVILDNTAIDASENRTLVAKPDLNINNFKEYPKQFEEYYNDSFSFRNSLVKANNYIKVKLFNTSPKESVVVGKDDWYYYTGDGSMKDYQGLLTLTEEELDRIVTNIQQKSNWLKSKGKEYLVVIAPDKQSVYAEYLPNNIKKIENKTRLDQIIERVKRDTDVNIIDLRNTIIKNKDKGLLYYKTDTHWNGLGAYYGYEEIINNVNKVYSNMKPSKLNEFNQEESTTSGDITTNMLNLGKYIKEDCIVIKKKQYQSKVVEDYYTEDNINIKRYKNENDNLPKLVMFRDSFTSALTDNLSEHFKESLYVWSHKFDSQLIIKENPDIVIEEMVERYAPGAMLSEIPEDVKVIE